jgi:hypothetical protein
MFNLTKNSKSLSNQKLLKNYQVIQRFSFGRSSLIASKVDMQNIFQLEQLSVRFGRSVCARQIEVEKVRLGQSLSQIDQ